MDMARHSVASLLATLIVAALPGPAVAVAADQPRYLTVASTTSTENSGLFRHILPQFTAQSGIKVRVVALGTGQALDVGRRGDADVVFMHDEAAERAFVSERHGVETAAGKVTWYRETGSGVGATLNTAAAMGAYTLSDRATWLSFANRNELRVLVEGNPRLFNQYGVILVNPARHPHVKAADAHSFMDWLVSAAGQSAIAGFRIGGEQASTRTRVRREGSNRMSRRNQR